jgi:CHAT domain-containing protein
MGLLYEEINNIDSALIQFDYCLLNIKKYYGIKNELYCSSLHKSANCSSDVFDFRGAEIKYQELLDIRRKYFKKQLRELTLVMNDLALNYHRMGEFKKSIKLNEECLSIRIKQFGESHTGYMMTLNNLASDYMSLGDYFLALELNRKCLDLRMKYLDENHSHIIMSLNNLGRTYFQISNYQKSKDCFEKAIKIFERTTNKNPEQYISTLLNLSDVYDYMDNYAASLDLREQCMKINDATGNNKSFLYTTIITKLSDSYYDLGILAKTEEVLLECLLIRESLFGETHLKCAETLSNLTLLYKKIGKYNLALDYLDESYEIIRIILGENHPDCFNLFSLKAQIYSDMGDFDSALSYAKRALDGIEKTLGKASERYSGILNDYGYYLTRLNKLNQAEDVLLRSVNTKKQYYSKENSSYYGPFNNLSTVYLCKKDFKNFFYYQNQVLTLKYNEFIRSQLLITSVQRDSFKKDLSLQLLSVLPILFQTSEGISKYSNEIIDYWFKINGINSNLNRAIQQKLTNKDSLFIAQFEEHKQLQVLYNYYCEQTKDEINNASIDLEKLKNQVSKSEVEIYKQLIENQNDQQDITAQLIKNNLEEDEVFLEIIRVQDYDYLKEYWLDSTNYIVIIVTKDSNAFEILKMPIGNDLDNELYSSYYNTTFSDARSSNFQDRIVYSSFWKPMAMKIMKYNTVYVSMNGVYNKLNLNTIYNPETGKYLLEEYDIHIVNSARDFVSNKESEKREYSTNTACLFGFPNFDGNSSISSGKNEVFAFNRDLSKESIDCITRGGTKVSSLSETKEEVQNISKTLTSYDWKVISYIADSANETNLKGIKSPRILHIATHGYFFPDIPLEDGNDRILGIEKERVIQDPMLRSGLLLSGANKTLKGEVSIGENGLLSAAEASLLDLSETELVVLSACETGKGEETNSEGVYGLRKAFSDAGAQNIIMSLWKVDDKVTQEFMSRFYEIWLNEKTTIRQAFNRTQLEIKAKYPEPYYWGAFILMGE